MKSYASILTVVGIALVAVAAEIKPMEIRPIPDNLLDTVSKPPAQQDPFSKALAERLAKSLVPTRGDAEKLAIAAYLHRPGLDALEGERVAGLYCIGRDVPHFASKGDLVWEVHVRRLQTDLSGVIWVSTTTKAARVLFPFDTGPQTSTDH